MSRFVIVSFYTKDNGYDKEAAGLIKSLEGFDIDHYVEAIDSLGSWMQNAHHTHEFILQALGRFVGRPIVWTDADSVLRRYPDLFDTLDCDLAATSIAWHSSGRRELLCGTMFFGNNDLVKNFLEDCVKMDKEFPDRRGAINLSETLKAWTGRLRFQELPQQYCKIHDLMRNVLDPVFEHYQASRRHRIRHTGGMS